MFRLVVVFIFFLFNTNVSAIERENDNTPWKAAKEEDSFTGNKWCYVFTQFMKAPDGVFMRDFIIPTNQRAMNKRGEFIDINYNLTLGLMGSLRKNVQASIDGTLVDMDKDMKKFIEMLATGEELRVRFEWGNKILGTTQETHSISLQTFSEAWSEASSMCR